MDYFSGKLIVYQRVCEICDNRLLLVARFSSGNEEVCLRVSGNRVFSDRLPRDFHHTHQRFPRSIRRAIGNFGNMQEQMPRRFLEDVLENPGSDEDQEESSSPERRR